MYYKNYVVINKINISKWYEYLLSYDLNQYENAIAGPTFCSQSSNGIEVDFHVLSEVGG